MPSRKRDRSPGTSQEEHGSGYSTSPAAAVGADRGVTGFPRANPTANEYGSGYISTPAAASGAASSRDGFPHTPQPAAEYGSGYGLDPAAANGASGVSARFPHTPKPSSERKRHKHQPPQLDSGEGPSTVNVLEANAGTPQFSQVSPYFSLLGANLSDSYPWLRFVPDRLRHRLIPTLAPGDFAPGPVLILLYAGRDDPLSLDSCIHAHYPRLSPHIVAFDTLRPPQALGHDLLADQPYGHLCQAAIDGRVRLVGGGPNCRTWSILRWFPKPNAPPPVRGRSEDLVWGLEALQPSEQQDVDNDSLLVLRLMFLIALMKQYSQQPTASFLEHPQDPVECSGSPSAHRCSSLWATKVFRAWQASVGHHLVKFDQCRLGQLVAKSTTLSSDLDICCWDGLKCNHPDHVLPEDMKSSDLSRYPPPMMLGLAGAISKKLQDIGKISSRPTISWNTMASTDPHVVHRDPASDRPSSLPLAHRISLMDENLVVQLGFRTRPLRDGGGKPSPGRLPPPLRRASTLAQLGTRIQQLTDPFSQAVRMSISCGEKNHPFPDSLLHQIREAMGAIPTDGASPGQPFFLTLISRLAKEAGDPDWEYPLTLQEGVPLGVEETTLTSPGVWPTKEELRGIPDEYEDLATPVGRHNYDSAEEFSDAIKQTFEEERLLDMVEGPFTKQEAANRCSCSPSQLCPGPMAAIDEGDKIRTIYDGSFGGANSHIQQNTSEKTTAPTVMDCMHGIHWINAAASVSPGDHTAVSQGERATASGVDSSSQGGGTWSWPGPDTTLLILKADVSKAHRRIKILPPGWKYQVAQIDQQWWVNKVGTYGVASAQLYWGRMAALLLRLLYYSFPEVDWGFVFVDDFCWLLRSTNCNSLTPALLAFLVALGVPLSWKKTVLSEINTWLGFVINPSGPFVQMARDKHVIVLSLLQDLASGKVFSTKAIEKALGRIQWATATCPLAKPFLQPFWQWKSACKNAGQPGKLVRCLAVLLSELFSRQFPQMSPFSPWSDWTGASDASAEPFGTTWIGGWFSDLKTPTKDQVYWFQYQLTQASHPWAFKKGDPQKRIAAIELYGTLFLVLLLMSKQPTAACRLHIPLISDNQGNVYSILNNATRKMPNAVILMELVYQIYQAGHMLAPTHSKRDDNQWADELTHPSPKGFSPALKVDIVPLFSKFALIPKLWESSDSESWFDTRAHP